MLLKELVEVFNDVFEHEHASSFRPFILNNERVSGLFGPIRVDSVYLPIRDAVKPTDIIGYSAQIEVAANNNLYMNENEIDELLTDKVEYHSQLDSIITFDRLSRTVHILNYLALLPSNQLLFLDVDPRHILGVKKDHGAYFQDFIGKCGLETQNVVVVLTVYSQYNRFYQALLSGLKNYRLQGYKIGLRFESFVNDKDWLGLIAAVAPDFVSVSSRKLEQESGDKAEDILSDLVFAAQAVGSQTLLLQVDQKISDSLAKSKGVDLVEGGFYRSIPFNYLAGGHQQKSWRLSANSRI